MKQFYRIGSVCALTILVNLTCPHALAAVTTLHHFAGGVNDGGQPQAAPIVAGSILYGTTVTGGNSNNGTVYKINTDGSGFNLLHRFALDGRMPEAALALHGSTLFGTTPDSTGASLGTVFKVNSDGSGFDVLHDFGIESDDGTMPIVALTLAGSTLYGTTELGGSGGLGTVFKINTDGTGYQRLHEFSGGPDDGSHPSTKLALSGSTLYGTTLFGGDEDAGTAFKVNTNGTGFQLLHEFADQPGNGDFPDGSLVLDGSTLYGTTQFGGEDGGGTVYKINVDGTGFDLLHEFGISAGPSFPDTGLTLQGSVLYGTSSDGGATNDGTIFKLNTDGSGFATLHEFSGSDGTFPSELTLNGSRLYGTTALGGNSGFGTLFYFSLGGVPSVPGDYNANGVVGPEDYDVWKSNFGSTSNLAADGNANGVVDAADYTVWRDRIGPGSPVVSVPGDYNGDAVVNQDDFNVWKSNFGSTSNLAADGNANGVVDAADYTVWRDRIGLGSTAVGLGFAVPEPPAAWSAVVVLFGALARVVRMRANALHA